MVLVWPKLAFCPFWYSAATTNAAKATPTEGNNVSRIYVQKPPWVSPFYSACFVMSRKERESEQEGTYFYHASGSLLRVIGRSSPYFFLKVCSCVYYTPYQDLWFKSSRSFIGFFSYLHTTLSYLLESCNVEAKNSSFLENKCTICRLV